MKLDNNELYTLFTEKGILELYHANTLATSLTFINANGLLSRGFVEELGLFQNIQSSDTIDKDFDVWSDIFLDTTDLHKYFNRQNYYGPILFKFSSIFLIKENFDIWVTKNNPIYWSTNMTDEEKYFSNVDELREKWDSYQRQKKMVTIRNIKKPILFDYLNQVVIDNPGVRCGGTIYFNECIKALKNIISENTSLKNKFVKRECNNCFCRKNYLEQVSVNDLNRLFLP